MSVHQYRLSRSIEASVIDYLTNRTVSDGWEDVYVVKGFINAYQKAKDLGEKKSQIISVDVDETPVNKVEIGSLTKYQDAKVSIRIFATSDGLRLDLKDWLIEDILLYGIDYNEYVIRDGVVSQKEGSSKKIKFITIKDKKELANTENLVQIDKFRHLIQCACEVL
jgi:hypothetical protein